MSLLYQYNGYDGAGYGESQTAFTPYKVSGNWLCGASTFSELQAEKLTKDELFGDLRNQALLLTWLLRLCGFFLVWGAFAMMFYPVEYLLSFTEYVPTMIGDVLEGLAGVVLCILQTFTFLLAAGVSALVIGICWIAVRPLIGIPLFIMTVGCFVMAFLWMSGLGRAKRENWSSAPAFIFNPNAVNTPLMGPPVTGGSLLNADPSAQARMQFGQNLQMRPLNAPRFNSNGSYNLTAAPPAQNPYAA